MLPRALATPAAALALLAATFLVSAPAAADEPVPPPAAPCNGAAPMHRNAPSNVLVPPGAYFSYPNTSTAERMAIRNRVLDTINSTNGRYCAPDGFEADGTTPKYVIKHGVAKIATWSFNDWDIANALKAADRRGVVVQAIAARSINESSRYKPWMSRTGARHSLGYERGLVPASKLNDETSWSHDCPGACRGSRGTAHSKFFLFQDVGSSHQGDVVIQTSMNLTKFAYVGQWNQARVSYDADAYADFVAIFYQMARQESPFGGYARFDHPQVSNIFFPKGSGEDPAMRILNTADCTTGTVVRVINYAFYASRGIDLARKLRELSTAGCDVRVIYSISSRGVMRVLRAKGPGQIPVKQSVVKNKRGKVVKYNHSKWVSVGDRVLAGSGNWSNNSFNDDEQFQEFWGASAFRSTFDRTWNQSSSKPPKGGRMGDNFRQFPEEPQWGKGELKFLTPEG